MIRHMLIFTWIALLILPLPPALAQTSAGGQFDIAPCPVALPDGFVEGEDVVCGTMTVPQAHANPDGPTLRIAVMIVRSLSDNPALDPLLMQTGGPSGSTINDMGSFALGPFGEQIRAQRDIVLIDMRGTMYSEPYLFCEPEFVLDLEVMGAPGDDAAFLYSDMIWAARECQDNWEAQGIDLANFDSLEIAADMVMTMDALGYETFNYYGVSYGTMLGQHLMRDYPDRLRSVILDSVGPLAVNYVTHTPLNADRAFGLLFEQCAADPYCAEQYPALEESLIQAVDRLNESPEVLSVEDSLTSKHYDVLLTGDYLLEILFNLMYSGEAARALPQFITLIAQDNPLVYIYLEDMLPYLYVGDRSESNPLYFAVTCSEAGDWRPPSYDSVQPYIMEAMGAELNELMFCSRYTVPALDDVVNQPVVSDIPTLVLAGEYDPVTPPAWGELVAATFSTAYVYTFPGVGHGALAGGPCPESIMLAFLDDPLQLPDASCIDDLSISFE